MRRPIAKLLCSLRCRCGVWGEQCRSSSHRWRVGQTTRHRRKSTPRGVGASDPACGEPLAGTPTTAVPEVSRKEEVMCHAARHRRESLGERVDYTEVMPSTKRALVCTVRGAWGRGSVASRRPERLLRAPRLALQVLELLRVARRLRGAAGEGRALDECDDAAWQRFKHYKTIRGRVGRARGRIVYDEAPPAFST